MKRAALIATSAILFAAMQAQAYEEFVRIELSWANSGSELVLTSSAENSLPILDNDTPLAPIASSSLANYYNAAFATPEFFLQSSCPPDDGGLFFRAQYACRTAPPPNNTFPVQGVGPGARAVGTVLITDTTMTGVLEVIPTNDEGAGPQPGTSEATGWNLRSADGTPFTNVWYGVSSGATLTLDLTGSFSETEWLVNGGTARFNDPQFQCGIADFSGVLCSPGLLLDSEGGNLSWGLPSQGNTLEVTEIPVFDTVGGVQLETLSGVLLSASIAADGFITTNFGEVRRASPSSACPGQIRWSGAINCGTLTIADLSIRSAETQLAIRDDVAQTEPGQPVDIDILDNDSGLLPPVDVLLFTLPGNGQAIVNGSPGDPDQVKLRYTPADGFVGLDSLQYAAQDLIGQVGVAEVRIGVRQANDDQLMTGRGQPAEIDVSTNDIGFNGISAVEITEPPENGTVEVIGMAGTANAGLLRYTPQPDFSGPDHFSYRIAAGEIVDEARVGVAVAGAALDDVVGILPDVSSSLDVLANDLGFTAPVTLAIVAPPSQGFAEVIGSPGDPLDARLRYTPPDGFIGSVSLTYSAGDAFGTDSAQVTVNVRADADGDDVDDAIDNCLGRSNAAQRDTDGDGFGNQCDADLDNSGIVNFRDLALFKARFAGDDEDADFDGNGFVNISDLARLKSLFGRPPGPSALAP